jgi:hypothetical protein
MRAKPLFLLIALALVPRVAGANTNVVFALTPAVQPGNGNYEAVFTGRFSNTNLTDNLYFNNLQVSFNGAATNYLVAGTNAFFANVPGVLTAGQTYSDVVFSVLIGLATPTGDYSGSVTIQGGTNVFDTDSLATLTFEVSLPDSVGDGIMDWWRQQYFGSGITTGSQSCATCDADGTGQNNLFKYIARLDPTNPASLFLLAITGVTNPPALTFGPAVPGLAYTPQFTTSLVSGVWSTLAGGSYPGPQTNGNQLTVTDTNAVPPQEFYRIQVTLP